MDNNKQRENQQIVWQLVRIESTNVKKELN